MTSLFVLAGSVVALSVMVLISVGPQIYSRRERRALDWIVDGLVLVVFGLIGAYGFDYLAHARG